MKKEKIERICKVCEKPFILHEKGNTGWICAKCRVKYKQRLYKERAVQYKGGKCQHCGYDKCNEALEFHHINPEEKDFGMGEHMSWERTKKELDKCILLCANCHREEHNKNKKDIIEKYESVVNKKYSNFEWQLDENIKNSKKYKNEQRIENICNELNISRENYNNNFSRRKYKRPTYEQFLLDLEKCNNNRSALGRLYGVPKDYIYRWEKTYKKYKC